MLKAPVTSRSAAILAEQMRIFLSVPTYIFCAGNIKLASPECVPAFSTCSEMAKLTILPETATASYSNSLAFSKYFEITTGCSGLMAVANFRNCNNWVASNATFMAEPLKTYEGLTNTGYCVLSANSSACDSETDSVHSGCAIPFKSISVENWNRSSAIQMFFVFDP